MGREHDKNVCIGAMIESRMTEGDVICLSTRTAANFHIPHNNITTSPMSSVLSTLGDRYLLVRFGSRNSQPSQTSYSFVAVAVVESKKKHCKQHTINDLRQR